MLFDLRWIPCRLSSNRKEIDIFYAVKTTRFGMKKCHRRFSASEISFFVFCSSSASHCFRFLLTWNLVLLVAVIQLKGANRSLKTSIVRWKMKVPETENGSIFSSAVIDSTRVDGKFKRQQATKPVSFDDDNDPPFHRERERELNPVSNQWLVALKSFGPVFHFNAEHEIQMSRRFFWPSYSLINNGEIEENQGIYSSRLI